MPYKMVKNTRQVFERDGYDEPDRVPRNITITNLDILMYAAAIVGYFVDLGIDVNIAVRYFYSDMMVEFGWTVAFIVFPAVVNTFVSMRMYEMDEAKEVALQEVPKRRYTRTTFLALMMAPVLRAMDALVYALKSRRAERKGDQATQQRYYRRMLAEDADAALLRVCECFLEAAPQHVLQTCLLMRTTRYLAAHQILSIISSVLSMGWCLAAYQRAIRFSQQDKLNMDWIGSTMQTVVHFMITISRVISIAAIAYLFPHWTILACSIHILVMATWLQVYDRPSFCYLRAAQVAFSLTLGAIYLFTYILSVEGRTRYRYAVYYTICFLQNLCCSVLWYVYVDDVLRDSVYYYPVIVLCIVPFCIGIVLMVVYYSFLHPRVRKPEDFVTVKVNNNPVTVSIL